MLQQTQTAKEVYERVKYGLIRDKGNTIISIRCRQCPADKGGRGERTAHLSPGGFHKLRLTFSRRKARLPTSPPTTRIPPRSSHLPPNTNCRACFWHKEERSGSPCSIYAQFSFKMKEKREHGREEVRRPARMQPSLTRAANTRTRTISTWGAGVTGRTGRPGRQHLGQRHPATARAHARPAASWLPGPDSERQ